MNVSYRWLRAIAPSLELRPEEVAGRLAMRGAPVEGIVDLAEGLGTVVIGRVETVKQHPNADRLSVCEVDGGNGTVQVVCGAPNVRAGVCYPFAPVGAVLPGDFRIKRVKIRGEESQGMLCSARELGLGADHEGILELVGDFEPGSSFVESSGLEDYRLDVEVSPNRGDLLSHVGVARELVGQGGLSLTSFPGEADVELTLRTESGRVDAEGVGISIDDTGLCPRYLGLVVRGVRIGPSPEWLASRLRAAGSRPINNVVDATNYVLLELGQPMHAFDLAKLAGPEIVVRVSRAGEKIRTLDGEERKLEANMLLICDADGPVAIAGVMGGSESEVGRDTTDVLLECALFDPKSVRTTRRALGMSTDASYRFERGVDPAGMETALRRAAAIVVATAGGEPAPVVLDACPRAWRQPVLELRPERVERLLGMTFTPGEIAEMLEPLGYRCTASNGHLSVAVPGYRSYDTLREVDLVEEVARVHGYDRFPDDLGPFRPGAVSDDPLFQLHDELRDVLGARGFLEAQTTAFVPEGEGDVEISNPISAEESRLRRAMTPGLLHALEYNFARGARDVRLFELGTVFLPGAAPGELPTEESHLAVVMTGRRSPGHWSGDDALDYWDLRGVLEDVLHVAAPESAALSAGTPPGELFDVEAGYTVTGREGARVGLGGMVRHTEVDAPAWAGPVWAFEIDLGGGPWERPEREFQPLPTFPTVERDLALLVPDGLPAQDVLVFLTGYGGKHLTDVSVFDLYRGEGVPDGSRSIAFRLRYQSAERTLTDKDVDRAIARVTGKLREQLGVEPRGPGG